MVDLNTLVNYSQQLMQVKRFQDYCPNGLQVEGKREVKKIVTGVSASMALLEAAKEASADLILVHHGYFWRNEDQRVVGIKRNRLRFLLENDINLLAYHLPLDAHAQFGNNRQFGKKLGITMDTYNGESDLVATGHLEQPIKLVDFSQHIENTLQRYPLVIGDGQSLVKKIAWCTGGAQSYMSAVMELDVDVYISGEISEQTTHQAVESGIAYIAAGHHATERYGVQALGKHLAEKFNLQHEFIDINNPV